MPVLTRSDFDAIVKEGCGDPKCEHKHDHEETMFLVPVCHEVPYVIARYDMVTGLVSVLCPVCKKSVCDILVADPVSKN